MQNRVQLAINVPDLDSAVVFYEKLFGVQVAKRKPGYANFEIDNPGLKLVLFASDDATDRLNHLGVEVFDDASVKDVAQRAKNAGLVVEELEDEQCCFARQQKSVMYAPDGTMWEWYKKESDLEHFDSNETPKAANSCC